MDEKRSGVETPLYPYEEDGIITSGNRHFTGERDVFGNEETHQIKYKTLSWQLVAVLMIAEIVSNGMLSLPSSGGVVGVSHRCTYRHGDHLMLFNSSFLMSSLSW
jgi:hypothetical protein